MAVLNQEEAATVATSLKAAATAVVEPVVDMVEKVETMRTADTAVAAPEAGTGEAPAAPTGEVAKTLEEVAMAMATQVKEAMVVVNLATAVAVLTTKTAVQDFLLSSSLTSLQAHYQELRVPETRYS